jgi:predicted MFS family arabinose efflux permease
LLRDRLGPLKERNFFFLFAAQATSFIGDGMVPVAISFAVLGLTGSVADVGYVFAARLAPMACLLLMGGVIADRLPRRALMVGADLARLASQGLLAALLLGGSARFWQLLALQAVHGVASAFFAPAVTGLVPQTVSEERLQQANALRWGANSAGQVVGPALAGVLVASVGAGAALAVDASTFASSACFLLALRLPPRERMESQGMLSDLVEGWNDFRGRTWLVAANAIAALGNAVVLAPFLVVGPAVAKEALGGASAWALIAAMFGAGSVAGGIVAFRLRPRRPMLVGLSLTGLHAGPLALLAVRAPAIAVAVAAFVSGSQLTLLNALWETTLQRLVPAHLLSRVAAYDWVSSLVFAPLGYALAGLLAGSLLGVDGTLWFAVACALGLAAIVPLIGDLRRLELPDKAQRPSEPSLADVQVPVAAPEAAMATPVPEDHTDRS